MRLYGALQELTSLVIRLASGKTVKIQASEQTAAGETQITIPDVVDGADTVVLVDTQQTMTNKTLTSPVVTNIDIQSSFRIKLPTAEPAVAEIGKLYYHDGRLKISNSTVSATAHDKVVTEVSTDTLQNKTINGTANTITEIDPAASLRSIGANGDKVVKYNAGGIAEVAKIVNANIADNANIDGSKLFNGSVGVSKIVTDDMTGTGDLVRENSPTIVTPSIAQINTPAQSLTVSGTGALKLPAGLASERPGTPVEGMLRYNSETDSFEGYAAGAWAGIGGGGTTDKVNQVGHNFVVGDVLYLVSSTYVKAIASAANTAEVVGVVSRVLDADNFEMTLSGEISGLTGLVAGEVYFLSASTAGLLTVTEPSVVGQVSLPVGVASSTTTLYVAPKRGVVVGAANARTTISVANNAATNVVDVTSYNSLKLEGELNVTRSAGGNQRAYYTVEAAKNGAGVWQVSASYTGDDVLYTTLPSWDVASNNLQVTMPLVTNFTSASLTYALNAPAVGASLPLAIDSSSLNIVSEAPLSYRNRIINGAMEIDQRNAGASVSTNSGAIGYSVDRFRFIFDATSKFTMQQNMGAIAPPPGFKNYLGVTSSSAYAAPATQAFLVEQQIEGYNVLDLDFGKSTAKTVTVSFWVRSSLTGTFAGDIQNAGTRSYVFTYNISAANTWEYKTITIPGDVSGSWNSANDVGLRVRWDLGSGSNFQGTVNSWSAGDKFTAAGAQSVVGTNGATFYLTGVQLEVGSKASAFERRPYGMELALCQRYAIRLGSESLAYASMGLGFAYTTSYAIIHIPLKATLRANPVNLTYSALQLDNVVTGWAVTSLSVSYASKDYIKAVATVASGLTPYQPLHLTAAGVASAYVFIEAEL